MDIFFKIVRELQNYCQNRQLIDQLVNCINEGVNEIIVLR